METVEAFLVRLVELTRVTPCVVARADFVRLLGLAGVSGADLSRLMIAATPELLTTDASGLVEAITMARETCGGRCNSVVAPGPWQPGRLRHRTRPDPEGDSWASYV